MCYSEENLFHNQEVLQLIVISFILMTLMFDLRVILKGKIRCWSLSGIKELNSNSCIYQCLDRKCRYYLSTSKSNIDRDFCISQKAHLWCVFVYTAEVYNYINWKPINIYYFCCLVTSPWSLSSRDNSSIQYQW